MAAFVKRQMIRKMIYRISGKDRIGTMGTELKKTPTHGARAAAIHRPVILLLTFLLVTAWPTSSTHAETTGGDRPPEKQTDDKARNKVETTPGKDSSSSSRLSFEHVLVGNYVFRGVDMFASGNLRKGASLSSAAFLPAYQPALKIQSPVRGLTFGLWGSFALGLRNDVDHDGRIEKAAEKTTDATGTVIGDETGLAAALINGTTPAIDNTTNLFRRDENGLKRFDEIDMDIDYRIDLGFGRAIFGLIIYYLPNSVRRGKPVSELYAGFQPAALPGFEIIFSGETETGDIYINPTYEYELKLGESLTLAARASLGYAVIKGAQGWRDVTMGLILRFGDFHFGLHAAVRPNAEIIERVIATGDQEPGLAAWLNGNSTLADGLVPDPSKDNLAGDIEKLLIERELAGTPGGYTHVTRAKLPRVLGWFSLGYTHRL